MALCPTSPLLRPVMKTEQLKAAREEHQAEIVRVKERLRSTSATFRQRFIETLAWRLNYDNSLSLRVTFIDCCGLCKSRNPVFTAACFHLMRQQSSKLAWPVVEALSTHEVCAAPRRWDRAGEDAGGASETALSRWRSDPSSAKFLEERGRGVSRGTSPATVCDRLYSQGSSMPEEMAGIGQNLCGTKGTCSDDKMKEECQGRMEGCRCGGPGKAMAVTGDSGPGHPPSRTEKAVCVQKPVAGRNAGPVTLTCVQVCQAVGEGQGAADLDRSDRRDPDGEEQTPHESAEALFSERKRKLAYGKVVQIEGVQGCTCCSIDLIAR
ncbi:hypothetical protein BESB_065330 [Besnoitia besnoiti]|uniref:Uncharacterized protein n=1 Tax=Besnoitia besnoiti TaxID=94643 RepID=A0A2A9ME07_BESBE|nr:hypothetical protein BESB_065330 [Besnoitia besnoiti]PFH34501.1 hypothetical protein BESB_065330 [Besnoitia besnoiti]